MPPFRPGPVIAGAPPGTKETQPKRSRPSTGRPVGRPASLKQPIAGTLMMANFMMMVVPPLRQDQLDIVEIDALATAIDDQCKRSLRFRKLVEAALTVSSGSGLLGVIAIIGARRASRHGLIDREADQMLGNLLAQAVKMNPAEATPFTPPADDGRVAA